MAKEEGQSPDVSTITDQLDAITEQLQSLIEINREISRGISLILEGGSEGNFLVTVQGQASDALLLTDIRDYLKAISERLSRGLLG